MRRFVLAAAMVGVAFGAQAADMPELLPLRGSIAPPPTRNWDGWYAGGQASYSAMGADFTKSIVGLTNFVFRDSVLEQPTANWNLLSKTTTQGTGFGGFVGSLTLHPFSSKNWLVQALFVPINFVMELPSFLARPVSLALRLYGNMYAGEMVFALLALLTLSGASAAVHSLTGWVWILLQVVLGVLWTCFDIFVAALQAFIFMMLTIVYLSQASEHH